MQKIKIQDGIVSYSASDPDAALAFNVDGQINVTKELNVGDSTDINGIIATPTGVDLVIQPGAGGNLSLVQGNGAALSLNGMQWPTGAVSPNPGMFLGASALNTLEFYPFVLDSVGSDTLTPTQLNIAYPNIQPGQSVIGPTVVYLCVSTGQWRLLSNGSGGGGGGYVAGPGIDITGNVISSEVRSAGDGFFGVQIGDGTGGFVAVATGAETFVLTSNGDDPPTWEPVPVSGGTVRSIDASGGFTGMSFTGGPVITTGVVTLDGVLNILHGGTGATDVAGIIDNILPVQTGHAAAALVTDGAGNLSWTIQPGTVYTAGIGLVLSGPDGTEFNSTVADNTGLLNRVQVSNGDGTLLSLPEGAETFVLTAAGPGLAPVWANVSGTVTNINIFTDPLVGLRIAGGDPYEPPDPQGATHIDTTGSIGLAGTLSVLHGGTGATTVLGIIDVVLPDQTGNSSKVLTTDGSNISWQLPIPSQTGQAGKFLTTDGGTASWQTPAGGGTVTSIDVVGGATGLTTSGGPVTITGVITLGGTLSIAHGGTGTTTAADAINTLVPDQTGQVGKILTTDGSVVSWTTASAGSVTSVDVAGGTTGLSFSGGPVTSDGIITMGGVLGVDNGGTGGTLPILHGGTGQTTATTAINALVPTQTGNAGKILSTDGALVSWTTASAGSVTSVDIDPGTTGLSFSGGPITSAGEITVGGVLAVDNGGTGGMLPVANGGTGAITPAAALTNLLPDQTGQTGKILTTDGSDVTWTTASAGSVTSVDISGSTTGLTFIGGPITGSGTITLSGVLSLQNGGTGSTSALLARNNILPTQVTHAGQVLTTDGTNVSWVNPATLTLPSQTGNIGKSLITDGSNPLWDFVAASSLSGTTLASNVVTSSLTTIGNLLNLTLRSGAIGTGTAIDMGRTGSDGEIQIGATTNDIFAAGQVAGDMGVRAISQRLLLGAGTAAPGLTLTSVGNVIIGTAALTTTATNGFLYLSSTAGTPTGTPTSVTGRIPVQVDSTNDLLYFYSNGAWRTSTSAAAGTLTGTTMAANVINSSLGLLGPNVVLGTTGATSISGPPTNGNSITLKGGDVASSSRGGDVIVQGGASTSGGGGSVSINGATGGLTDAGDNGTIIVSTASTRRLTFRTTGAWQLAGTTGANGSVGTSGQVLTSQADAPPIWAAPTPGIANTLANATTLGTSAAALSITGFSATGAPMTITSGTSTGTGNSLTLASSSGVGGANAGGAISLTTGAGAGTGAGGAITMTVGLAGGGGGAAGGAITLTAGQTVAGGGTGGNIVLNAGLGAGTGGALVISTAPTATLTERLRILPNGAWSVGTSGTATGTSGQVLTSAGSAAAPTWQTASGASLNANNVFTKGQVVAPSTLTNGATVSTDASLSNNFRIVLSGNFTLANPTNLIDGQIVNFVLIQDATGSRVITYDTMFKFPSGDIPPLSTTANAIDFLSCYYDSTTGFLLCSMNRSFS